MFLGLFILCFFFSGPTDEFSADYGVCVDRDLGIGIAVDSTSSIYG
jgi:hypothetical protein